MNTTTGYTQIQNEIFLSTQTRVDWDFFCRDIAIEMVFKYSEQIGVPGIGFEIIRKQVRQKYAPYHVCLRFDFLLQSSIEICLFAILLGNITEVNTVKGLNVKVI